MQSDLRDRGAVPIKIDPALDFFAGIVVILMLGGAVISDVFVLVTGIWAWVVVLPIAVPEMAMAPWFILKGIDRQMLASLDQT